MNPWEREEEQLYRDFDNGLMTRAELNAALRDLNRDYRDAAQDAAQEAYDRELGNW